MFISIHTYLRPEAGEGGARAGSVDAAGRASRRAGWPGWDIRPRGSNKSKLQ